MVGNICKNGGECTDAKGVVAWNGDVMFPAFFRGQAEMAAGLAGDTITERPERFREILPREITRKPQMAITSSRTKCSRTTLGA